MCARVCVFVCVQQEMELRHLFCVTANVACRKNLQGAAMHVHTYYMGLNTLACHYGTHTHTLYTHTLIHTQLQMYFHQYTKNQLTLRGFQTLRYSRIFMCAHTHTHTLIYCTHTHFSCHVPARHHGSSNSSTLNIKGGFSTLICCWKEIEEINSAFPNTHTHTHTHTHTRTHTYTHTQIQPYKPHVHV